MLLLVRDNCQYYATPREVVFASQLFAVMAPADFWDTAGQERFASMHPSYYYRANACILVGVLFVACSACDVLSVWGPWNEVQVFDVTRKATYTNLAEWYKELRVYCENIPVICVANKIDVDEKVTKKAFQFPKKHDLPFYFVSAADGTNVVKVCSSVVR
jgi:Rab-like protein 2